MYRMNNGNKTGIKGSKLYEGERESEIFHDGSRVIHIVERPSQRQDKNRRKRWGRSFLDLHDASRFFIYSSNKYLHFFFIFFYSLRSTSGDTSKV